MKNSRLRSDPAKTREWQDRSRARAVERAREASVDWSPPAAQRVKTKLERVHFRARDSAANFPCERCARLGVERAAAHWHHWLAQEFLKVYVRGQRLDDDEAARLFRRLIHDRRNYSPVCVGCHGNTGLNHAAEFTFEDVPPAAFAFAAELGGEWVQRLRRKYLRAAA